MAALNNSGVQYVDSSKWASVTAWITAHPYAVGVLVTNTANSPAVGSERVYVSIVAGTSHTNPQPTFNISKGSISLDGTGTQVHWMECTGQPGVNGDITNSPVWGASLTVVLGQIIYDSGTASLQIASATTGSTGSSKPSFSATAGVTASDNNVTWTSLGLASAFGAFAAPHARRANADAATWMTVTPATVYIGNDNAETQAQAMSVTGGQGTASSQVQYLCVSNSVAPPTSVTTGATLSTTGANSIGISGNSYYVGLEFDAGSSSNAASIIFGGAAGFSTFENCVFKLNNTSASSLIDFLQTTTNASFRFLNCTFVFGATGQSCQAGFAEIIGGSFAATGTVPTVLFTVSTTSADMVIRDCDLSAINTTLINQSGAEAGSVTLENCKTNASVAMTTGTIPNNGSVLLRAHNYGSGATNYHFYESSFLATIQDETTIVDNTNIASNGTTQWSVKIVTTANTTFGQPYVLEFAPVEWQNTSGGSITVSIQINSNVSLNSAQIWPEVEYLGSSSTPQGSTATGRATDVLTAGSTWTTSSDSWGGSETHQQVMSLSFTPQQKGPIKVRVMVADPSLTVYVNPLAIISGVPISRTYMVPGAGIVNELATSAVAGSRIFSGF